MSLSFVNCCLFCRLNVGAGVGTSDGFVNMGAGAEFWVGFVNLGAGIGSSLGLMF